MNVEFEGQNVGLARDLMTVSQLNRTVSGYLARTFALVHVRGEIGNFTRAVSGHWYFVLKDHTAQVRCVMFRGRNMLVTDAPREGDEIEIRANVTVYEARGEFQLVVESLVRSGQGRLYEAFLRLKQKLAAEGLFDEALKRQPPVIPMRIGVVTSLAAAALRDVVVTLAQRAPYATVVVYPVSVQGEGAAEQIAQMLARASQRAEVDVVLLVRGGGSIEDLWAFNEEVVARAVRASAVPVICGVGHETDFTIADFAADVRAATPTAAAQRAAPAAVDLIEIVRVARERLKFRLTHVVQQAAQHLDYALRALSVPRGAFSGLELRVQALCSRASHAINTQIKESGRVCEALSVRLQRTAPTVERFQHAVQQRHSAMAASVHQLYQARWHRLHTLMARLHALDPQAVLTRGYTLTTDAQGRVVTEAAQLLTGDTIRLRFAKGSAQARVLETWTDKPQKSMDSNNPEPKAS